MNHPTKTRFRVRWSDTLAMIGLCIAAAAFTVVATVLAGQ